MQRSSFYPIGTPGRSWALPDLTCWRGLQSRQRSYTADVLRRVDSLGKQFDQLHYGDLAYAAESFSLVALRSSDWQPELPSVLITGGVHGYETSGVLGALRFLETQAQRYKDRLNLLVVPCVSPWAYQRVQRWNFDAVDPNRSFRAGSPAHECVALMQLIEPWRGQFVAHIDLHETTDTDESEFRPALAARDGATFEPCNIPDGFYVVDDADNPQPDFQQAIIDAVQRVTHIAVADEHGKILDAPAVAQGVIRYAVQALGLCTGITGARYTTTTEVYPDSARTTPEQCIAAQVVALCAALEFV
ncbi:MAG: M14 family metallocarboxypeptidase [Rhodoferax sp.]|nr:M14 family metallocarboxypeptidase [Rhodoferax sp.]